MKDPIGLGPGKGSHTIKCRVRNRQENCLGPSKRKYIYLSRYILVLGT